MPLSLDDFIDVMSRKLPDCHKENFGNAWELLGLRKGSQYKWAKLQEKAGMYHGDQIDLISSLSNSDDPREYSYFISIIDQYMS